MAKLFHNLIGIVKNQLQIWFHDGENIKVPTQQKIQLKMASHSE